MSADGSRAETQAETRVDSRGEARGMVEVVLAMALAGSSVVVGKLLSVRIPVFLSVELSLCAALAAILPAQIARRREIRLLGARELFLMFLQALFGIVLFRAFTLSGLRLTSALNAGVITSAAPAVMAVLARVILGERIGRAGSFGVFLAVAGLLLINLFGPARGAEPGHVAGNLLVLAATVCEALLTIFRKTSGGRISSVTNTTILVAMSAVMMLPLALVDLKHFDIGRIEIVGWLSVIYYGAFATVIAYILWGDGALRIPASRTGIATAALPGQRARALRPCAGRAPEACAPRGLRGRDCRYADRGETRAAGGGEKWKRMRGVPRR